MSTQFSVEALPGHLIAIELSLNLLVHQETIKEWYTTAEVAAILDQNLQRSWGAPC